MKRPKRRREGVGNEGIQAGNVIGEVIAVGVGAKALKTVEAVRDQSFSELAEGQPGAQEPRVGISILFLSADPTDASRLRLGEELREVREKLRLAKVRERITLDERTSVRAEDITQALLDVAPTIVHFSGHGTATGDLCFEDHAGRIHSIDPLSLAALFARFAHRVRCVMLNACYSEAQATAIAEHIEYVIGMNKAIGDRAAIAFATGFYQAIGAGLPIEDAYELGCVQIRLQAIPEHLTPVIKRAGLHSPTQ